MNVPTGYTALDLVGFTDKGAYSSSASYVKNDLVNYGGNKWICLIDDTTNITPEEGLNWHEWIELGSSVSIAETGTASASSTRKQQLTIDGVNTDINGTKYLEQTISAQANTDTTFTFSSSELTYASVLDIFVGCKTADYDIPTLKSKTLSVSGSTGTLTLVYNVPTAYALTVRVYIRG